MCKSNNNSYHDGASAFFRCFFLKRPVKDAEYWLDLVILTSFVIHIFNQFVANHT